MSGAGRCSVFISGFLIVALQIVWYRLIGVLLQSNGYSFSLVLSVFLLGDAAGLLVGARTIDRIADPRRFFLPDAGHRNGAGAGGRVVRLSVRSARASCPPPSSTTTS